MHDTPLAKYLPNVSKLIFGCMGLGGGWNKDPLTNTHTQQAHACIDTAIAGGINLFDHADIYTFGKAEQVFGQVLKQRPELREQIYIQSIQFLQTALDMPIVANQIEASLKQSAWVDEGVYVGNRDGKDINFTPGFIEYCTEQEIQIQSWGSLCQGLYSGKQLQNASPADINTAILVNKLAALYRTSAEAIVLAWLLRHPALIQPVIGTTNAKRLAASCSAVNIELTREHWYALYVSAKGHELP